MARIVAKRHLLVAVVAGVGLFVVAGAFAALQPSPSPQAWHDNGVTMAPVGVVQCPRCRQATTPKDPAAREWTCPVCSKVFRFLRCEVCPAYGPIGAVLPGGQRVPCVACGQPVRVPRLAGDKRWGTAADMAADIELRGMPFPRAEPTVPPCRRWTRTTGGWLSAPSSVVTA